METKYGFELELFLINRKGELVSPLTIGLANYVDGSGVQLEVRGTPNEDIYEAYYSVIAQLEKLKLRLPKGIKPAVGVDWFPKNEQAVREQRKALRIKAGDKDIAYYNINGSPDELATREKTIANFSAGLHLHISKISHYIARDGGKMSYTPLFDFISLFHRIEKEFETDMLEAERVLGFYEMKPWGVEYRSLPSSLFFNKSFIRRLSKTI